MPYVPGGPQDDGSDTIAYPIDLLRTVAAKILLNATNAQTAHNHLWSSVQQFLNEGPGTSSPSIGGYTDTEQLNVRYYLNNVLEPHQQRIQDSYTYQIKIAQALFDMADQVEGVEERIKASFGQGTPTPPRPTRGPF